MVMTPQGGQGVLTVYNNANKIFNLHKGRPIGCVAFGAGSIGNASVSTLLKDFRARLKKVGGAAPPPFDVDNFSMEAAAAALSAFLESECDQVQPPNPKPTLGILIGGYSSGQGSCLSYVGTKEASINQKTQCHPGLGISHRPGRVCCCRARWRCASRTDGKTGHCSAAFFPGRRGVPSNSAFRETAMAICAAPHNSCRPTHSRKPGTQPHQPVDLRCPS